MNLASFYQRYLREWRPRTLAWFSRALYVTRNVRIGDGFRTDGLPRILVDDGASLEIAERVEFRSGVEIRVHGTARVRIGPGVRIDRGVRIPEGLVVGEDAALDAKRFNRSEKGICLITQKMIDALE